jgi:periplasmic protein TonB
MTRITFDNEKEIRVKSFAGAAAINLLLLAILFFVHLSQTIPDPPPIEFIRIPST